MAETNDLGVALPRGDCDGDDRASLDDLISQATAKDAIKDFSAAAELYSEATELQAKLNGELALDNADLLFAYGKALYNVAVSKSDVLGSKVATEPPSQSNKTTPTAESVIQDAIVQAQSAEPGSEVKAKPTDDMSRPYFQFTGDENFDDSDTEDEDDPPLVEEEEEDDFANAYEVLDLARILFQKKLNALEEDVGKGKSAEAPSNLKQLKERLADTYDLQAEISLEAERFADAVADLRTALSLRQSLFPMEDPSVAECHYKLSLALEFGSVSKANDDAQTEDGKIDEEMRKEAIIQMEHAIESCRVRMTQEQAKLDMNVSPDEDKAIAMKRKIANVKDIISDMEQRLVDLQRPAASSLKASDVEDTMLRGILGQIVGQPVSERKARLDAVTENANDLSALVKRKPTSASRPRNGEPTKRRMDGDKTQDRETKRARTTDLEDTR
ncbi:tetratricopeptide repeat domain protein [Aspergillus japonicus CBS 114.51]|uniref:Tetratricopeptide repeat domain protein n=1 Tax=Aspergillus japonicus CBS 114.51 TaxID=1448312 RepID=A0A8T8WNW6_ASPJA|nr:tetratricopeptide repeat domain protein [Aspergillus japonicus CBS 114.51]RAH77486.1 tetratricopeptide repeat domain protein [Aspergillus japonicus CBS 114.51]